jgi:hypothetical protein
MADSAQPPPPTPVRRGPPPIPARNQEEPTVEMTAPLESAVSELLALVVAEADAADNKRRASDLRARAALLIWDGLGDGPRAVALLDKVEHPIAAPLKLAAALIGRDEAALALCVADARKRGDKTDLADVGGLLFWRDPTQAAELFKLAGDEGTILRRLALGVAGLWGELVDALSEPRAKEIDSNALAEAAQAAQDRLSDVERAKELVKRALDKGTKAGGAAPYVLERAPELGDDKTADVYKAKLAALGADDDRAGAVERAATRYLLAAAHERAGADAEAAALVANLCALQQDAGFGALLAWRARARLESKRGEWTRAAEAWEKLAEMSAAQPAWSAAYLRRAAELWEARGGDLARAEKLWARLHADDPADGSAAAGLVRTRLAREARAEAAEVIEAHGRARGESGLRYLGLVARAS